MGTIIPFRKTEMRDPQSFRELLQERVPVHARTLLAQGGPQEADWHAASAFTGVLGPNGDEMQLIWETGSKKQQEVAARRDEMAQHIAAMSFLPGGIRAFGMRFQVVKGSLSIEPDKGDAGQFIPLHMRNKAVSYYTPRELIECLLDTALEPVLDDAIRNSKR